MIGTSKSSGAKFAGAMVLSLAILVWSGCGGGLAVAGSDSKSERHDGYALERHDSLRRHHPVHGPAQRQHRQHEPDLHLVGQRSGNGNATVGSIDQTGKYRAPATLPTPHSVTIKAVSNSDKTHSATSSVSLQNPIPVLQNLSPTFLPVGNFTLTVGGANFVNGSKVMFGGTALATTYVGPTQLTATGTTTAAQVGTVKITVENPDPGKSNSAASMNVQVGAAGQVSVVVIPATTQITAGSTFQYRAALNGAGTNTAVKWAINGIPNGNATVGTISPGGVYQAPATVPIPNTIQVQATSLADTTATSTGTATITNPAPVVSCGAADHDSSG